jgi:hypothetical protein
MKPEERIDRGTTRERVKPRSDRTEDQSPAPPRQALAWKDLDARGEPPAREWIIPWWVPHHHLTLLPGDPGVGKTLLAQHLGTALALGHEYLEPLEPRRVLMWAGEDDHNELWRRQVPISSWMGAPLSALAGQLYLHSYCDHDITLATFSSGNLTTTPMLAELRQQVLDYRAEVVILDNVARLFGGNEIDRHQVTAFCAAVKGAIAPAAGILLAHPARAEGSEFSGSGAWEAAVRSRLFLGRTPPDAPDDTTVQDEDLRYLSRRKANYSDRDLRQLRLIGGVLIPSPVAGGTAKERKADAQDVVRKAVRALAQMQQAGVLAPRSPDYLPTLAQRFGLLETLTVGDFSRAMYGMLKSGELIEALIQKYAASAQRRRLALKGEMWQESAATVNAKSTDIPQEGSRIEEAEDGDF